MKEKVSLMTFYCKDYHLVKKRKVVDTSFKLLVQPGVILSQNYMQLLDASLNDLFFVKCFYQKQCKQSMKKVSFYIYAGR